MAPCFGRAGRFGLGETLDGLADRDRAAVTRVEDGGAEIEEALEAGPGLCAGFGAA